MSLGAQRTGALRELADHQAGLLTRSQLRKLGVGPHAVASHIAAERWRLLSPRVVALHTGPLSREQMQWFAVLDGGAHCALAGLSALHEYGLRGFPVDRVQTAVPLAGRHARHEDYVRRRSRRVDSSAIHPARRPPMLRIEPALVDALEQMALPLRGCALLAAVVQQRLIRDSDIRPLICRTTTLPNRDLYLSTAGDIEGGAHSLLEIDFHRLARRAGLPRPVAQAIRQDRWGRRRYLDADFGGFGVEVDGAIHLRPLAWWDDMWRLNEVIIRDKPMLRFPSVGVRLQPERVMDQLHEAARRWL